MNLIKIRHCYNSWNPWNGSIYIIVLSLSAPTFFIISSDYPLFFSFLIISNLYTKHLDNYFKFVSTLTYFKTSYQFLFVNRWSFLFSFPFKPVNSNFYLTSKMSLLALWLFFTHIHFHVSVCATNLDWFEIPFYFPYLKLVYIIQIAISVF